MARLPNAPRRKVLSSNQPRGGSKLYHNQSSCTMPANGGKLWLPLFTTRKKMIFYYIPQPIAFSISGFAVYWYALSYIASMSIVIGLLKHTTKRISPKDSQNLFFEPAFSYVATGVIIGGRLGHVLLFAPLYYLHHPLEILALWSGGMSFHGGMVGTTLALGLLAKKSAHLTWGMLCSLTARFAPIGMLLGRIANFLNGELVGVPTNKPWGVVFLHIDSLPRHPVQLYEAFLEGALLFLYLWAKSKKTNVDDWYLTRQFVYGYSLCRFMADIWKEHDNSFPLTNGQIYAVIATVVTFALWRLSIRKRSS